MIKFTVPDENGGILVVPPREALGKAAEENRAIRDGYRFSLEGISFRRLRAMAEEALGVEGRPILGSAHQPGLPHPGILFKLVLLESLATRFPAAHLVLDSDLARPLRYPCLFRKGDTVGTEWVALWEYGEERVLETTPKPPRERIERAWKRTEELLNSLPAPSMAESFRRFREIDREAYPGAASLPDLLGQWRRGSLPTPAVIERRASEIFSTSLFDTFFRDIARRAEDFQTICNEEIGRSGGVPFAPLQREGGRFEIPFWFIEETGERRRLFSDGKGGMYAERDGETTEAGQTDSFMGRVRPRAAAVTLFFRLLLFDLFIHGVGGGNYDRTTDRILSRYYGIDPPRYAVATATLHLPLPHPEDIPGRLREVRKRLRDLSYHPERFLAAGHPLAREKRDILKGLTGRPSRDAHRRLGEINREISASLQELGAKLRDEENDLLRHQEALAVIQRRDWPFFFFDPTVLRNPASARGE